MIDPDAPGAIPAGRVDEAAASEFSVCSTVAAVIVVYRPRRAQLNTLIDVLALECRDIYVLDNGEGADALTESIARYPALHIVDMKGNRGIGTALNLGFHLARLAGAAYVVSFDQDSRPPAGLVNRLLETSQELERAGVKVAAVGPRLKDSRGLEELDYPFMRRRFGWPARLYCTPACERLEVDYLITSGCLVSTAAFAIVGEFDQELFVDCVDMEWCFRAASLSYRVYGVCTASMYHEIGGGGSPSLLGLTVTRHSPARRYYYARNTVRLLGLRHVSWGWKARMLFGLIGRVMLLPFAVRFAKGWRSDWIMLIRGILDGIAGTGGACTYASPEH
jgi:rhamnosyltransferase